MKFIKQGKVMKKNFNTFVQIMIPAIIGVCVE